MAEQQLDIEAIVREVLRRLQRGQTSAAADKAVDAPGVSPGSTPSGQQAGRDGRAQGNSAATAGVLKLDQRVVTLTALEGRLAGMKRLLVPHGAVLTPSVRDALRKKRVELVFADRNSCTESSTGSSRVAVAALSGDATTILKSILADGGDVERVEGDGLMDTLDRLGEVVATGSGLAVLLTPQPAAAVCLANRRCGVRAVWGVTALLASEAAASIGANLLVVDPGKGSLHELRSMIKQFVQNGVRPCPAELAAALA